MKRGLQNGWEISQSGHAMQMQTVYTKAILASYWNKKEAPVRFKLLNFASRTH